jgi:hypothetical protein
MADTLLVITPISSPASFQLPPFSARGLTQTLDEIDPVGGEGLFERNGNGGLINYTRQQFQKLKSTITCRDQGMPALNNSWRGATVQVDCVHERWYPNGGSPDRTVVPGTSPVLENGFYSFYPRLTMIVRNVRSNGFDEWGAAYAWQMDLEEA